MLICNWRYHKRRIIKTSLLRVTWFLKCVQTAYNCAKLACQAEGCWTCKTSSKVFSFSSLTLFWCHQEYFLSKSIEEHCQLVASQQHWVESHFQVTFLPLLSPAGPSFPSKSFWGREIFALRGLSCQGWRRERGQAWSPRRSPSEPWGRAGPWAGPRSEPTCGEELRRGWRWLWSGWCSEAGSWTFLWALSEASTSWQRCQCHKGPMRCPQQKRGVTDLERIDWKHPHYLSKKFYLCLATFKSTGKLWYSKEVKSHLSGRLTRTGSQSLFRQLLLMKFFIYLRIRRLTFVNICD